MKKSLVKTRQLVSQGANSATLPLGEIPVLDVYGNSCFVIAANFLRCGAPAVQIVVDKSGADRVEDHHERCVEFFTAITTTGEGYRSALSAQPGLSLTTADTETFRGIRNT